MPIRHNARAVNKINVKVGSTNYGDIDKVTINGGDVAYQVQTADPTIELGDMEVGGTLNYRYRNNDIRLSKNFRRRLLVWTGSSWVPHSDWSTHNVVVSTWAAMQTYNNLSSGVSYILSVHCTAGSRSESNIVHNSFTFQPPLPTISIGTITNWSNTGNINLSTTSYASMGSVTGTPSSANNQIIFNFSQKVNIASIRLRHLGRDIRTYMDSSYNVITDYNWYSRHVAEMFDGDTNLGYANFQHTSSNITTQTVTVNKNSVTHLRVSAFGRSASDFNPDFRRMYTLRVTLTDGTIIDVS